MFSRGEGRAEGRFQGKETTHSSTPPLWTGETRCRAERSLLRPGVTGLQLPGSPGGSGGPSPTLQSLSPGPCTLQVLSPSSRRRESPGEPVKHEASGLAALDFCIFFLTSTNLRLSKDTAEALVNEFRPRSLNRPRSEAFAARDPNYCHFAAPLLAQQARQAPGSPLQGRISSQALLSFGNSPLTPVDFCFSAEDPASSTAPARVSHPGARLPSGGEE